MNNLRYEKIKVKNCIRKDTYRYILNKEYADEICLLIQNAYDMASKMDGINLLVIENNKFKIVKPENDNRFTLIKKKKYSDDDDSYFHHLLGDIA